MCTLLSPALLHFLPEKGEENVLLLMCSCFHAILSHSTPFTKHSLPFLFSALLSRVSSYVSDKTGMVKYVSGRGFGRDGLEAEGKEPGSLPSTYLPFPCNVVSLKRGRHGMRSWQQQQQTDRQAAGK